MKKVVEGDKLTKHVPAFRISESGNKKLEYWARKENRTKRGYLQNLIHNLPEVPEFMK